MGIKTKIIIGLVVLVVLVIFGVIAFWPAGQFNGAGKPVTPPPNPVNTTSQSAVANQNENGNTGIANPASVNCVQKGGKLEIRTVADGGQVGYCIFPDDSTCEEWQYFRGQCQPKSAPNPANSNNNSANPTDNTPQRY
jgi:uncharacterized protein